MKFKEKHDRKKEKLLESACNIFTRFGFEKATMSDIAKEARKGKSSLYYYFSSKEEIFEEVVDLEAGRLKVALTEAVEGKLEVKEKMIAYFTVRMQRFNELVNLYAAMRHDYLSKLDFIETLRAKYDQEEMMRIQAFLTEGVESGEFAIGNIEDTSYALASALKGLEFPLVLNNDSLSIEMRIKSLIDVLFYGIVKR